MESIPPLYLLSKSNEINFAAYPKVFDCGIVSGSYSAFRMSATTNSQINLESHCLKVGDSFIIDGICSHVPATVDSVIGQQVILTNFDGRLIGKPTFEPPLSLNRILPLSGKSVTFQILTNKQHVIANASVVIKANDLIKITLPGLPKGSYLAKIDVIENGETVFSVSGKINY